MSKLAEVLAERREAIATAMVKSNEVAADQGLVARLDRDDRQQLRKSSVIYQDEMAPEVNDLDDVVRLQKSGDADASPIVKELAELNDAAVVLRPIFRQFFHKRVEDSEWFRGESRRLAKKAEKLEGHGRLAKILVTGTSGAGSEWVPTGFSADLWNYIESKGKIAPLFPSTPMPWNPYRPPYVSARISIFLGAQASENFPQTATSAIPQTRPTTGNFTLTAKKLCAMIPLSDEMSEDSVVPVIPQLRKDIGDKLALERDNAIINGDTSADHMDADVDNATGTDVRLAFSGLRKYCRDRSTLNVQLSTFNIANLRSIVAGMDRYGENLEDLFWVCGVKTRQQFLSLIVNVFNSPVYVQGVAQNGSMDIRVDGMPLKVTSAHRESVNASGVRELTTNGKTTVLAVNRTCFTVGVRKEVETELWRDPRTQTWYLIIWERKAFGTPYTDTTNDIAANMGINLTP